VNGAPFPYTSAAMRRATFVGAVFAFTLAAAGCSRNNIEAVNLAIEGDKEKSMNIDGAISKYEQATNLDPTNHRILWKLALAYTKKEEWDKVATTCAKAQKVAPDFANYHFQHGMALARQAAKGPTSWADAQAPLEQALKLDPNIADAYFELAEVKLQLDDEAGAIEAYSKAIETKPDELVFYGPLADLYIRLNFINEAEQVLREGLAFAKEGDKFLFQVHSLLGQIAETKGDTAKAVAEYEAAKKACGPCNEPGQQIAFFNLGAAYASMSPPRKSEAMAQLQSFQKMICKGAAAQRYADQCSQAQQLATRLGGALQ
jgi:tetratricopeptide (TPR) repeat protein